MKSADILIFGGQSNMQGQSESLSECAPVVGASEYRFTSDALVPLQNPVGENLTRDYVPGIAFQKNSNVFEWRDMHVLGGACYGHTNLVPAFCRAYLAQTKGEVVAVHAAKGSTQIHEWLPSAAGYEALVKKASAAIRKASERYAIKGIYFVWLQGESDAIFSVRCSEYTERLHLLNNALKKDLGIQKFGIIRVGRFVNDERDDEIIRAQTEICRTDSDFLMLTEKATELNQIPKYMNPEVAGHFSALGLETLGSLAGEALGRYEAKLQRD